MVPALLGMRPRYVEKLWGGERLARLPAKQRAGHEPPTGVAIGEAWEVADLPEGSSTVEGGPLHGRSLTDVVQRYGREVVGDAPLAADGALRFPILVKLIDAGDDLSVQVHPDLAWARAHPGAVAKDEAWLVVDAAKGARVLHGAHAGIDARSFRAAIDAGRADGALREVPVAAGQVIRIEPGTLHAIGKGCLMLEVQEPSDTTFRVWDFGRVDRDGRPRALHVEDALAVARFGALPPAILPAAASGVPAVVAPRYTLSVVELAPGVVTPLPSLRGGMPGALFALKGDATVRAGDDVLGLPVGASAVLCARGRASSAHSVGGATLVLMSG